MEKPTFEQWKDYLCVQKSGITNMLAIQVVCSYSLHKLTRENCMYIYEHYSELAEEYKYGYDDVTREDLIDRGLA